MSPEININCPYVTLPFNMDMQPSQESESEEANEALELCLDNKDVIPLESYQKMLPVELDKHFKEQFNEFIECNQAAQAILKNNADSLEYSQCVSEAEKKFENIKNIIKALSSLQQPTEFHELQYNELTGSLQNMHSSIPQGNSIVLRKDRERNSDSHANHSHRVMPSHTSLPLMQQSQELELEGIKKALKLCLDNKDVIPLESYQKMLPVELDKHFKEQFNEFIECNQAAQAILKNNADSLEYSQCVSEAEKKFENIKNIIKALSSLQQPTEFHELQYNELTRSLQNMHSSIPLGNSIVLRKDIEMMRTISSVPQEKTYHSPSHGTFYEPQISPAALGGWFHKHLIENSYEGVSIARKIDCIYDHQLNTMCTLIGLKKKKYKRDEEGIQKHSSSQKTIKGSTLKVDQQGIEHPSHRFPSRVKQKIKENGVKMPGGGVLESIAHYLASNWSVEFFNPSKEKSLEEIRALQKNVLDGICEALPEMLGPWNYEKWEVGTSKDLIEKYEVSPSVANEADYVILFHKKCEQPLA
ncbi:hypothetical protein [Neochlamydia sp. AcF95]|uniref:hypothetical protein n=1 Tax=Neochlamydia sp. AcF95 TaxID=2795734 RepID=UPI001BC93EBC|nr:hypothetical protein [Neochlamydia sp. AcF95]